MKFNLKDHVVIITGGAGLLGEKHAEAVVELGGIPVLFDINEQAVKETARKIEELFGEPAFGFGVDVTSAEEIEYASNIILRKLKRIDVLINNAANNPKMEGRTEREWSRLESFSLDDWNADIFAISSFYEGFCIPILEAMAAGLPVVVNNKEPLPEVLSGTGIVVENTPEAFEEAFKQLISNPQIRKELGERAKTRAMKLDGSIMEQKEADLYEELITEFSN